MKNTIWCHHLSRTTKTKMESIFSGKLGTKCWTYRNARNNRRIPKRIRFTHQTSSMQRNVVQKISQPRFQTDTLRPLCDWLEHQSENTLKTKFWMIQKSVYQIVRRYYFYPAVIYRCVLNVPDNYRKTFVHYAGAQLNIWSTPSFPNFKNSSILLQKAGADWGPSRGSWIDRKCTKKVQNCTFK